MRIESLHYVRRRGGGDVEMTLDDGSVHTLDPDLVVQFRLQTGMELAARELDSLRLEQEKLSARRRLIRYLSLRRKTARESERYLRELKFGEEAVQNAVEAARGMGYIDDERFAEAYTATQDRAKKGPRAIRQELLMRGVEKDVVEESIVSLETPEVQKERARQAAAKRAESLLRTEADRRKAQVKLMQFLMRRGFDGEICSEVARELLGAASDEE